MALSSKLTIYCTDPLFSLFNGEIDVQVKQSVSSNYNNNRKLSNIL